MGSARPAPFLTQSSFEGKLKCGTQLLPQALRPALPMNTVPEKSGVQSQAPAASGDHAEPLFPFVDLKAQFATIRSDITAAVIRVLEEQQFILGREVEKFEEEIAEFIGVPEAVSCASGTAALELALRGFGIGPGDEVITTPYTFAATAGAIAWVGARPVFVDIELETFNLDSRLLESAITPKTRAIIPVHLFGLCADMDPILDFARKHHLAVIEDAAQAIGATYRDQRAGSLGDLGCFSFFPSKNLGGAGDGGLMTTRQPELADRLRLIRVHGSRRKYIYETAGTNSRLDAIQAAILRAKLPHLATWTRRRQENAGRYDRLLVENGLAQSVMPPSAPPGRRHVYNQYVMRCPERDQLRDYLGSRGIPTEVYYPVALHLQPAFSFLNHKTGQFPRAEKASREALSLPIFPEISAEQQSAVIQAIAGFYGRRS